MSPRVLILDASERSALAFIRSLGRKGIEIIAGDSSKLTTGQLSRYVKKRLLYPSPEESWSKFIKFIIKILSKGNYDLLIPISEFTITIISYHKEELEDYTIVAAPDYNLYIKTYDKAKTIQHARKHEIPHPKTFIPQDPSELKEIAKEITYPAVIKPRRKTYWHNDKAKVLKVTQRNYANSPEDLVRKYSKILQENKELINLNLLPMIQEYIPGSTYGYEALLNYGQIKAYFMHKRLAEYPTTGGASTLRESTYHPTIAKIGAYTLQTLKWHGLAMAEFKLDPRDRTPKLIEINGRPWGSLPLAITAGVDFPYLLYKMFIYGDVEEVYSYKVGVKQKWLIPGHILWFYASIKDGRNTMNILKEFIKSLAYPDDIIDLKDPLPALGALKVTLQLLWDVVKGYRKITGEMR